MFLNQFLGSTILINCVGHNQKLKAYCFNCEQIGLKGSHMQANHHFSWYKSILPLLMCLCAFSAFFCLPLLSLIACLALVLCRWAFAKSQASQQKNKNAVINTKNESLTRKSTKAKEDRKKRTKNDGPLRVLIRSVLNLCRPAKRMSILRLSGTGCSESLFTM